MSDTLVGESEILITTPLPPRQIASPKPPRLQDVVAIAFPMVVSQASEIINLFVDRLFLSHLGKLPFAASMTGGMMYICVLSFFIGVIAYVNAIVAQHDGAGDKCSCARAIAQAVRFALISWPLLLLFIPLAELFLQKMDHGVMQIASEMAYFRILVYGAGFELLRHSVAGFFIGLGKTRIVMLANLAGMMINIPANWVLIFGKFGLPAMGIEGAAIGTVLGRIAILTILVLVYFSKPFRENYATTKEVKFNRHFAKLLFRYGAPAGCEMFLNLSAFTLFINLMHSYGSDVAAAVTIVFNYDMLAFVPMLGLGFSATTLAGRYIGAEDIPSAKRATRLNLYTAWSYALLCILLFSLGAPVLVDVFSSRLDGSTDTVVPLARTMLRLAVIYILADATQLIFAGSLRGAGDTRSVMWISVVLHWIFAMVSWYSVRVAKISPLFMWLFFIGFALSLGVGMFLRYRTGKWQQMRFVLSAPKER